MYGAFDRTAAKSTSPTPSQHTFSKKESGRSLLAAHTPQQNGVAIQKNWHIIDVARAVMNEKHLPKSYWAEAMNTAVYLMN